MSWRRGDINKENDKEEEEEKEAGIEGRERGFGENQGEVRHYLAAMHENSLFNFGTKN